MRGTGGTFLVNLGCTPLSTNVIIVVLWTTFHLSVPSLVMRKGARKLVRHVLKQRKTLMVVVEEAAVVELDAEVELDVVENEPLGVMSDDAAKKGANSGVMKIGEVWKMHCSKCGINDTHTLPSIMTSSFAMRLCSGFQHIIHGILRLETSTRQQRLQVHL